MAETRFETVARILSIELEKPYSHKPAADCFFMGLRVVDALDPGLKLERSYRGSYTTLRGAQRALVKRGFKSLADLFAAHLVPCAPALAQVGDIAIIAMADGDHVAVCAGGQFITKTASGPVFSDLASCTAAFRVG